MDPTPQHSVELQLAESGRDLIAAIEAAQFARVIDRGEASGAAEAAAIEGFAELFAAAAESWERLAAAERARLLARLGDQLERLERPRLVRPLGPGRARGGAAPSATRCSCPWRS